jgi:phosphatidylglycerol:prolipoprotein diacylglycerol transferase
MPLAIQFPSWLKPEVIPGLPIRWYGVMYIVAFGVAFLCYRRQIHERKFPMTDDELSVMFFWCILGLLLGARIFATLVYETSDIYRRQPWLIFWPFRDGRFTGLMGMSYHGGAIGGTLGIIIYSRVKGYDAREIGDMYAGSIPLGYTFGRLGNFINGELFGRITASPLGIIFPYGGILPSDPHYDEIREAAGQMGLAVPAPGNILNLPRHPSQLYEALFEGLIAWAITWLLRNKKPFKGFLFGFYFVLYGFFRFFIEYFREPDENLGYRIEFVKSVLSPAVSHPPLSFSTGQILCVAEIVLACIWLIIGSRLPGRTPIRVYGDEIPAGGKVKRAGDGEKISRRNKRRKLRKKLR